MKHTILLVDNDLKGQEANIALLRDDGYRIRVASTPHEARQELMSREIDLAIIDMRLEDDDDEHDVSGLMLAADESFSQTPKIILTAYPLRPEEQRRLWRPFGGEPPAIAAVVHKDEGPETLLEEIINAFKWWPHLLMSSLKASERIKRDHKTIRTQARWHSVISLIISLLGFGLVVIGIIFAYNQSLEIGIVGAVSGLVLEAVGYLFYTQMNRANDRMDLYHRELLQTYWLELLISLAEGLPAEQQNACKEHLLRTAAGSWYPRQQIPELETTATDES